MQMQHPLTGLLNEISCKVADAQTALYAIATRDGIDGTPLATELMAIHSKLGEVTYDSMSAIPDESPKS